MNFVEMALHRCCTSVHFSIQPTCTPARDGGSVGVVSNFSRYSGAQIHSLGRRAFQAVGSYMRHWNLRLSGHSWKRPVTAQRLVIL